jgi:hypothetical protein
VFRTLDKLTKDVERRLQRALDVLAVQVGMTGRLGRGPLGRKVFGHHGSSLSDVAASRGPNPRLHKKDNGITFVSE